MADNVENDLARVPTPVIDMINNNAARHGMDSQEYIQSIKDAVVRPATWHDRQNKKRPPYMN